MVSSGHPRARYLLTRGSEGLCDAWWLLGRGGTTLTPRGIFIAAALFLGDTDTLTDGLGEELAWPGFALPRLLSRHNALVASLVLGVIWALWHLLLLWTEGNAMYCQPVWLLLVDIPAKSVLFTWVFLHTRGSVLLAMLFHGATNLFVVSPDVVSTGGDLTLPLLAAGAKWVLVVVMIVVAGPGLARGPRPEALPRTQLRAPSIHPST